MIGSAQRIRDAENETGDRGRRRPESPLAPSMAPIASPASFLSMFTRPQRRRRRTSAAAWRSGWRGASSRRSIASADRARATATQSSDCSLVEMRRPVNRVLAPVTVCRRAKTTQRTTAMRKKRVAGFAIWEQRDRFATFETADDCPVTLVASPCLVVDPDYCRGLEVRSAASAHEA
jgi:hypothetical protein